MFVKILYFVLFVSTGVVVLKYRKVLFEWTGRWGWAEKYLGNGGTVTAITFIGLGLIFAGVAYPMGAFDDLNKGNPMEGSNGFSTA